MIFNIFLGLIMVDDKVIYHSAFEKSKILYRYHELWRGKGVNILHIINCY